MRLQSTFDPDLSLSWLLRLQLILNFEVNVVDREPLSSEAVFQCLPLPFEFAEEFLGMRTRLGGCPCLDVFLDLLP
jgi:hypothetical protein